MTVTFDEVLTTARQLAPRDRARLVALIVEELAAPTVTLAASEAWATMQRLRQEFAALPRPTGTLAEQLERDRNERESLLIGQREADVHA